MKQTILLTILLTLFVSYSSAQERTTKREITWRESCSGRMKYVSRNQVDPPIILLNGVNGRSIYPDGASVSEICVGLFTEKGHRFVAQTMADENGYFRFHNIPNGNYRLVGRVSYDFLCPVNVRIQVTKKTRQKQLVLHMTSGGIDTCSYGDTK